MNSINPLLEGIERTDPGKRRTKEQAGALLTALTLGVAAAETLQEMSEHERIAFTGIVNAEEARRAARQPERHETRLVLEGYDQGRARGLREREEPAD